MSLFLNPAWLWGLAAVAIPVLIHLFFRRRFRIVHWGAMRFLRQAVERSSRRQKLTHWALLAVRMLLLALLAAAFARPFAQAGSAAAGLGLAPQPWVLVIDRSASMGWQGAGGPVWEAARGACLDACASMGAGDRVALVESPPAPEGGLGFSPDRARLADEIRRLSLSDRSADLPAALSEAAARIEEADLRGVRILAATDLQRLSFGSSRGPWTALAARLRDRATVTLLDVGEPDAANLSVASLEPAGGLPVAGRAVRLRAEVRNAGPKDVHGLPVSFWVDGEKKESRLVDAPAGGSGSCEVQVRFDAAGEHVVEAEIPADPLSRDNRRACVIAVRSSLRVLVVADAPEGAEGLESPAAFLEIALAPSPEASPFAIRRVSPAALAAEARQGAIEADLVFASGVERFGLEASAALSRLVRGGGGLVLFLSERTDPEALNRELGEGAEAVLPARLLRLEHAEGPPYRLAPPAGAALGAFLSPFPQERGDLGRVAVWKRWTLDAAEASRTLVQFADGPSALVAGSAGRGTVLLFAAGAETAMTNLPARPLFVPLVHQMAQEAARRGARRANLQVGDWLDVEIPARAVSEEARLAAPGGAETRLAPVKDGEAWRLRAGPLEEAGLWRLEAAGASSHVAVGMDPAESDLSRAKAEEVAARLPGVEVEVVRSLAGRKPAPQGAELSRLFLGLVLAFLYVESLLAWWSGRSGARQAAVSHE